MSLSGIFDPVARAYFKNHSGGSGGGSSGGITVVNVPVLVEEDQDGNATYAYPYYDLSEVLGAVMVRVSDYAPSIDELEGGIFFNRYEESIKSATEGVRKFEKYDLTTQGTSPTLSEDRDLPGMLRIGSAGQMTSFSKSASQLFFELLGIEILPGLYVNMGPNIHVSGVCLIYGL